MGRRRARPRRGERWITLTTDFGTGDGYVGVMKGVIYGINPQARIVDLSHDIPPQDIARAAFLLARHFTFFPPDTIHLVVVDPGVGGERRPLLWMAGHYFFVGPDNGVVSTALRRAGQSVRAYHLNRPRYWLPRISSTFHGRDIFAPVAAHLSRGILPRSLGQKTKQWVALEPPALKVGPGRLQGRIAHIDRFGNLLTNIPAEHLSAWGSQLRVRLHQVEILGLARTFADGAPGNLIAYLDSDWHLAIGRVLGSAQTTLGARVGDPVEVLGP
ncbi:MAG: SAM-dependent chlorinase/fluorinase [Chloroflexi bacterium]|nr:SAM-dependent chlorinase/fluorinase [Chloroflexota bacterium]